MTPRKIFVAYSRSAVITFAAYMALSWNFEPANWAVGVVFALGLSFILGPRDSTLPWKRLPMATFASLKYMAILWVDIFKCGFSIARTVMSPTLSIKPGIIVIPSPFESEIFTSLAVHAITVTPGEIVVEIDDKGLMYTHCLDVPDSALHGVEAQKRRTDLIQKIIG